MRYVGHEELSLPVARDLAQEGVRCNTILPCADSRMGDVKVIQEDMAYAVAELGMTPLKALQSATVRAAVALGVSVAVSVPVALSVAIAPFFCFASPLLAASTRSGPNCFRRSSSAFFTC